MLTKGDLVHYYYLWARESEAGEETGRKSRPTCIAFIDNKQSRMLLFPVTTQLPGAARETLAIHEMECRRAGLTFPSWIVCDECNAVDLSQLYDFESLTPIGQFSAGFLNIVVEKIRGVVAERKFSTVRRT
jgi:hypothetical protein